MKVIYKIARAELQVLFYSPVAWLILVIFTFQSAMTFNEIFDGLIRIQAKGREVGGATMGLFSGYSGFYPAISKYLFLYIPLLTMGVISREYDRGSIKLLLSSPISGTEIVLGKYLALVVYGLALSFCIGIFAVFSIVTIDHAEVLLICSGLIGMFLLICAFSAIGLFISSITSYIVVSAMGTLAVLAFLGYVSELGQDIPLVRDITYWFSVTGRVDTFFYGLITLEDVLYFVLVVGLFLGLAILRLQLSRQKSGFLTAAGKYAVIIIVFMAVGYLSTLPKLMVVYDLTRAKTNTITKNSQDVVKNLGSHKLTISTFMNMFSRDYYLATPSGQKQDMNLFKGYRRFKPEISMDYYYYYDASDNPDLGKRFLGLSAKKTFDSLKKMNAWDFDAVHYDELEKKADLKSEDFECVRLLELDNGKKTFLRFYDDMGIYPSEAEVTAAIKRLTMELPVVGFLKGHAERNVDATNDRGYRKIAQDKKFRAALINQGFDYTQVTLDKHIPNSINILVIAEPRTSLSADELENLRHYIQRGGNMILAGEPNQMASLNPIASMFGVKFLPGLIVKPGSDFSPDLMMMNRMPSAKNFSHYLEQEGRFPITMPGVAPLAYSLDKGFDVLPLFQTDSLGWNELEDVNFIDNPPACNQKAGEVRKPYPAVLALSRRVNAKTQKILVTGDADWLSNGELAMSRPNVISGNPLMINAAFFWLSDGEVPIDTRRPGSLDNALLINENVWKVFSLLFKWALPTTLVFVGLVIWLRRKGK